MPDRPIALRPRSAGPGERAGTVRVWTEDVVIATYLPAPPDRNLTDADGPYIELMAGVYTDNQPDFSWISPAL